MPNLTRCLCSSVLLSAAALLFLSASAGADDATTEPAATSQPSAPPPMATTAPATKIAPADLSDLDSDQYSIRQAATQRLLTDNHLTLDSIAAGYAAATTLEQKHRLLEVARHHFLRLVRQRIFAGEPLGSIGIGMTGVPPGSVPAVKKPAIRVQSTMPGFPAYPLLQGGDVITAINGRTPQESDTVNGSDLEFKQLIAGTAQTGRPINLTVIRDGRSRQISVEPAGRRSLNLLYDYRTGQLCEPVQQQWDRYQKFLEGRGQGATGSLFEMDYAQLKEDLAKLEPQEEPFPLAP